MGDCKYCRESAGFLRSEHKACREKFQQATSQIPALVADHPGSGEDPAALETQIRDISSSGFVDEASLRELIILGWQKAVDAAFDDGVLSPDEEEALVRLVDHFSLSQKDLEESGYWAKLVKGAVIRDLLEGQIPERVQLDQPLSFNFQKSEQLIWVFTNIRYYEEKRRREYKGGTHGVSFRVAKGVYYRVGAFKGHAVDTSETVHVDDGTMAITTKHTYFGGEAVARPVE